MTDAVTTGQENTGAGGTQGTGQPVEGQKPAGEIPAGEGQGGEQGQKPAEGAKNEQAVDYDTFEFKHPDGGELDQAAVAEFRPLAKEMGLKPEHAQKLVDFYAGRQAQQLQQYQETQAKWVGDIKADKEVGGDRFEGSMEAAEAAINHVGDPALKDLLNTTGLGNHPVVFKAFAKLGKAFVSDKPISGGRTPSGEVSTESAFYPTMQK